MRARRAVDPGLDYFSAHFVRCEEDSKARPFSSTLQLFAFAGIFHPIYGREWITNSQPHEVPFSLERELAVEVVVRVLKSLGPSIVKDLKEDFGRFQVCLQEKVDKSKKYFPDDVLSWWRDNGSATGAWARAARLFVLLQPSSASVERAFSILRASVT